MTKKNSEKKAWEKPTIKTIRFTETAGGNPFDTGEDFGYYDS